MTDAKNCVPFLKMHGLGNDFVVIDGRANNFSPNPDFLRALGDRRRGVGCDQIVILRQPQNPSAAVCMDLYNADGSKVGACGNATRCIASLMFEEKSGDQCVIETVAGLLAARREKGGMIAVDFCEPRLNWDQIPLVRECDTLHVPLSTTNYGLACCVSMGNPHAVLFVPAIEQVPLTQIGPVLEHDPMFPDRCNIEFAQIISPARIRMRVWERGAGVTDACGSGACATLVAAVRRGLCERRATIVLDGGELLIEWREDGHVIMTGSASLSYRGFLPSDFGQDDVAA